MAKNNLTNFATDFDDLMMEQANLSQRTTGLDYIVWVKTKLPDNKQESSIPLLYIQRGNEIVPISISNCPKIIGHPQIPVDSISEVIDWIITNQDNLLKLWFGEITTDEFLERHIKH